jgi:hypothetical protein
MMEILHFVEPGGPGLSAICGKDYTWFTTNENEFWDNVEDACDDCEKLLEGSDT